METLKIKRDFSVQKKALQHRLRLRNMSAEEFINEHASGTLRKNKKLGMVWKPQYLEERTAFEFGWGFECFPRSRVTFGDAITEGDSKSITEAGWHIYRYITLSIFPEDIFETKYIIVDYGESKKKEGIGIIIRKTSANYFPGGSLIFAIVATFDPLMKTWKKAENPA